MRLIDRTRFLAGVAGGCMLGLAGLASAASTFSGNGASGFGGTLGGGSLTFSDSAGNLTATFNPSGGFGGNDVVVYIDSVAGGYADTSLFGDNADGGREAVSAESTGSSRDLISFPSLFGADYALEFENNTYTGLFQLATGGNNSLNYITGAAPAGGGPYTVTFPLSDLGLTQGQSFNFVADLISTSAYGSNETIGTSTTISDVGASPNAGFNGSVLFSSSDTYSTTAVPEPVSLSGIAAGALLLTRRRRVQY